MEMEQKLSVGIMTLKRKIHFHVVKTLCSN